MEEQTILAALVTERKMYSALNEVMELTEEMAQAVQREDPVSVRLFLKMRREPIVRLGQCREQLMIQCQELPRQEGEALRAILSGQGQGQDPDTAQLETQVRRNRALLDKVIQADRRVNQRMGGKHSFYTGSVG